MNDGHSVGAARDDAEGADALGTNLMVIRAWTESEHENGFRARLRFGTSLLAEPSVVHATDPEQVLEAVRNWLSSLPEASVPDEDEDTP